jgi:hypothetical protein
LGPNASEVAVGGSLDLFSPFCVEDSAAVTLQNLFSAPDARPPLTLATRCNSAFQTRFSVLFRTRERKPEALALPGYAVSQLGEVLSLTRALPWWSFRKAKGDPAQP